MNEGMDQVLSLASYVPMHSLRSQILRGNCQVVLSPVPLISEY